MLQATQYQRRWTPATNDNSPQLEFNHKNGTAGNITNGEGQPHSYSPLQNSHEIRRTVNKEKWRNENQPTRQVTELRRNEMNLACLYA